MSDDKKGMLRHVDVLGRVVIPREVRKALRIGYGDLMEFCACSDKQVIMRKFHLIDEIAPLAVQLIDLARLNLDCEIIIIDTEKVVCYNDQINKDLGRITDDIRSLLDNRKSVVMQNLVLTDKLTLASESVLVPVVCDGDILGGVVVNSPERDGKREKIASLVAEFLSQYFRG